MRRPIVKFVPIFLVAASLSTFGCGGSDIDGIVVDPTYDLDANAVSSPANAPAPGAALPSQSADVPAPAETSRPIQSASSADSIEIPENAPTRGLFNGENLDGWTNETGGAPGEGWRAEDGLLRLVEPGKGGDLLTADKFENYALDFEWRFGRECNSGVKYKLEQPNGKGWIGLEYQIQDDANVEDGKIADRRIASLFDVLPAADVANPPAAPTETAPTGDFRRGRIVVSGKRVEHWLDGEKVLAFEVGSDAWNAAKADSKYKKQATYGETASSPILLQDHGSPIDFRNIKLTTLPAK